MKEVKHSNKMVEDETKIIKKDVDTIFISPTGNQHVVVAKNVKSFKSIMGVDKTWVITEVK